jgi:transposase-like protein
MRYSAAEKLEIIQLVEQSHLPQRRSLASLGIPRQTFYRWYDRFRTGGPEALADRPSRCPSSNDLRPLGGLCNGVSGPSAG